ncbi:beta-microseminoprotein-like [Ranitomeya variabilis]|uniref:beta-microseminoprotein-like n=1 Tax=Ranitomeya variabilis TaxID=490064 RepID=UPI004056B762
MDFEVSSGCRVFDKGIKNISTHVAQKSYKMLETELCLPELTTYRKHLLVTVFAAAICLAVCNAACFMGLPEFQGKPVNGCFFQGEVHPFSSKWITKDCLQCSCGSNGMLSCCTMLGLPMQIEGDECEVLEDKETCTMKIVYKDDHSKEC